MRRDEAPAPRSGPGEETEARQEDPIRGLLWGVATSAFQLEGAPSCDWTTWKIRDEEDRLARLRGVGHLERTQEDLALLRGLGVNAYRFSLEWSRVVPSRGGWDQPSMDRYVRIASGLREAGIEPVVTLHHFTTPSWLASESGWDGAAVPDEFLAFAERAVRELRDSARIFVTLNEPNVYVLGGYLGGVTPPGRKSYRDGYAAFANLLRTHAALYDLIHAEAKGPAAVGIAHNLIAFRPASARSRLDRWAVEIAHAFYNLSLIEAFRTGVLSLRLPFLREERLPVGTRGKLDFLGVNYYFRMFLRLSLLNLQGVEYFWEDRSNRGKTEMGWEVYPEGFEEALRTASLAGVPILVTENGAAESDDRRKISYLREHLEVLRRSIRAGVDVRGYFWWSLLDNYEWLEGLRPRFGLYRTDFETLERSPTAAGAWYRDWIRRWAAMPSGSRCTNSHVK